MTRSSATLVVFSGLPGTGKSTLGAVAAAELGAALFALAPIYGFLASRLGEVDGLADIVYDLLAVLAGEQLQQRRSAVIDAMTGSNHTRRALRDVAHRNDAHFVAVECVASDEAVHQERIAGRIENIDGWVSPGWDHVERMRTLYEPWDGPDSPATFDVTSPLDANIDRLCQVLAVSE